MVRPLAFSRCGHFDPPAPHNLNLLDENAKTTSATIVRKMVDLFQPDPTRLFPPLSDLLKCSEENHPNDDGENEGAILFSCTVAGTTRLCFRCRDVSIGVMYRDEPVAAPDTSGAVDPFFFDCNYDLYGKTGFQIWPGSRLMTETLTSGFEHHQPPLLLSAIQEQIRKGARVLELGSGIGFVGISLAAAGAQALVTDLPTLVNNAIQPNIERNVNISGSGEDDGAVVVSTWLAEAAVPVGRGWAGAAVLDLMKPLADQLVSSMVSEIDLVVSCDVLCFRKLLDPVLDALDAVFAASPRVEFIFTYQRRDKNEVFTTLEDVLLAMELRGWSTPECLAWRKVYVGKNDEGADDFNALFLFRTTPKSQ